MGPKFFNLTQKEHLLVRRVLFYDPCEEDTTKFVGHCYEPEMFYFTLENEESNLLLYVEMAMMRFWFTQDVPLPSPPQGQIRVSLRSPDYNTGTFLWAEEFDESDAHTLVNVQEEMTLLGEPFTEVLIREDFHYTKESGLVAFKDGEGMLWVLE